MQRALSTLRLRIRVCDLRRVAIEIDSHDARRRASSASRDRDRSSFQRRAPIEHLDVHTADENLALVASLQGELNVRPRVHAPDAVRPLVPVPRVARRRLPDLARLSRHDIGEVAEVDRWLVPETGVGFDAEAQRRRWRHLVARVVPETERRSLWRRLREPPYPQLRAASGATSEASLAPPVWPPVSSPGSGFVWSCDAALPVGASRSSFIRPTSRDARMISQRAGTLRGANC